MVSVARLIQEMPNGYETACYEKMQYNESEEYQIQTTY